MIYTDRSRIVARGECAQMGYLQYFADGKGWQREATSLPLVNGIALHDAHAKLLAGYGVDEVVDALIGDYRTALFKGRDENDPEVNFLFLEQVYMVAGMVRTWAYHRLPKLLAEFEVAKFPGTDEPFVEKEFTVEIAPGISAMLRLDAVLRRKSTGKLVIWDFKSLGYVSPDWYGQWEHNPQTYLYTHALKTFMNEPVEGIAYEGLIKGIRRVETGEYPWNGRKIQVSPYCYAYQGPDGSIQVDYTSKRGFHKIQASSRTTAEWFTQVLLPANAAKHLFEGLFCIMPVISPLAWEVERWLRQVTWAEYANAEYLSEIRKATDEGRTADAKQLIEMYFPTNEGRCFKYGADNKCQFIDACFTKDPEFIPLGFVARVPHHTTEADNVDAAAAA